MAARIADWIDEPVEVGFVTRAEASEPQQSRFTLEGTDRAGVLLGYIVDESDPGSEHRILFFPWHRIEHIHLVQ